MYKIEYKTKQGFCCDKCGTRLLKGSGPLSAHLQLINKRRIRTDYLRIKMNCPKCGVVEKESSILQLLAYAGLSINYMNFDDMELPIISKF